MCQAPGRPEAARGLTGVCGFVRHPRYLGGILMFAGAPLLLGSYYGVLVGFAQAILLVIRSTREEELLVRELEGYHEYTGVVRYRLVPYIW
jgi:protein-S-isoprenylcysteine O-methyltransferase Ste14